MNARFLVVGMVALATMFLGAAQAEDKQEADPKWHVKLSEAREVAKKENKLLLLDFTGSDWCGYCIKLKKKVFDTQTFKTWANKNVVLVELDFPRSKDQPEDVKKQNEELKKQFNVKGFPTIVVVDVKGTEKAREVGYGGAEPADWIKKLEEKMK